MQKLAADAMLDHHTCILHDVETSSARFGGGRFIGDAGLHPDSFGSDVDGLVDKWWHVFAALKDEDEINVSGYGGQIRISCFTQGVVKIRVHGNDFVTLRLQVCRHVVAGAVRPS